MTISFDLGRHADMVDVLVRAANSLEDLLRELEDEVSVLRGSWSGLALDAYDRAQRDWTESLRSLNSALRSATRIAHSVGETLSQADRDAAGLWN